MFAKEKKTSMSAHVLPPASIIKPTYCSWRRRGRRDNSTVKIMHSNFLERFMACSGWEIPHIFTLESQNELLAWRSPGNCWAYKRLQPALFLPNPSPHLSTYSQNDDGGYPCLRELWHRPHLPSSNRPSFQKSKIAAQLYDECGEELSKSHCRAQHGY